MRIPFGVMVLAATLAVSACGSKGLRDLRPTSKGPDEFLILPAKPLAEPENLSVLVPPTPGGSNLTDATPKADAVAALGGKPSALDETGAIPSSDGALVTVASRHGVDPDVRSKLAEQDAKIRKRENRFSRLKLFPVDRYEQAYKKWSINPFSVNDAYRNAGAATPSAPPAE